MTVVGEPSSPSSDPFFVEAPAPLAVLDETGAIVRANAAFARAMSDGANVIGRSFAALFRAEDHAVARAAVVASGPTTFEARAIASGGSAAPRSIRFTVARTGAGVINVVGVEAPESAEGRVAQLEQELHELGVINDRHESTLQVFSQLLDTAPIIVWATDSNGTFTIFEGKGLELVGSSPGLLVGQNALQVNEGSPEMVRAIEAALRGESTQLMSSPVSGVHLETWFLPLYRPDASVGAMALSIDVSTRVQGEQELRDKLDVITQQSETIRALATPIIQVWDDVLCLPVIGTVDRERTAEMMERLLVAIVTYGAHYAIVDLTGLQIVDTSTADHLIRLVRAAKLIGANGILCGIRPAVAETLSMLGLELDSIPTMRTMREALKWCIQRED